MSGRAVAQLRNRDRLLDHGDRQLRMAALDILESGLAAADVARAMDRMVARDGDALLIGGERIEVARRRVFLVGAGKATLAIAERLEELLGDRLAAGVVAVRRGTGRRVGRLRVLEADHPVPDAASQGAARAMEAVVERGGDDDVVLACFTGGSSALACDPPVGVTLADKRRLHELLLASGMSIVQVNCVRKHVSAFKGGRLAARARARILNLTVSDVVGDRLDAITDPTVQDTTSVDEAIAVLREHGLWDEVPASVRAHLATPEATSPVLAPGRVSSLLLIPGRDPLHAMLATAQRLGYRGIELPGQIEGESRTVGAALAREAVARARRGERCALLDSGGETTVSLDAVAAFGVGGPNQEAALSFALELQDRARAAAAFTDSDGSDGGTDYAGAVADARTVGRARALAVDLYQALEEHHALAALARLGDLVVTGPTGTNVNDLVAVAVEPASS